MQFSVASPSELKRVATITVPAAELEKAYKDNVKHLSRTKKVPGFRAGKLPLEFVEKNFGNEAFESAVREVADRNFREFLNQEKPDIAVRPEIAFKKAAVGSDLVFDMIYEVFGEVQLCDLSSLQVERVLTQITDDDVDDTMERIRSTFATFEDAPDDYQSVKNDRERVTLKAFRVADGAEIAKLGFTDGTIIAGRPLMVPGIEEQFLNRRKGETFSFEVDLPESFKDLFPADAADRKIRADVQVHSVSHRELPAMNSDFFRKLNMDPATTIETFRQELTKNMEREMRGMEFQFNMRSVLDALKKNCTVPIPESCIRQYCVDYQQKVLADAKKKGNNSAVTHIRQLDPVKCYGDSYRDDITTSRILGTLVEQNNLKPSQEDLNDLLQDTAAPYEEPEKVREAFAKDRTVMARLQNAALSRAVVDLVFSKAQVTDRNMSFKELTVAVQA